MTTISRWSTILRKRHGTRKLACAEKKRKRLVLIHSRRRIVSDGDSSNGSTDVVNKKDRIPTRKLKSDSELHGGESLSVDSVQKKRKIVSDVDSFRNTLDVEMFRHQNKHFLNRTDRINTIELSNDVRCTLDNFGNSSDVETLKCLNRTDRIPTIDLSDDDDERGTPDNTGK